jgi:hypothetical protein
MHKNKRASLLEFSLPQNIQINIFAENKRKEETLSTTEMKDMINIQREA